MDVTDRVQDLPLTMRTRNCLLYSEIRTVGDLLKLSPSELRGCPNLGRRSLAEIINTLESSGMRLKDDLPRARHDRIPENSRWTAEMRNALIRDRETMTLSACAEKYGVTRERIRQIMASTARRLYRGGMGWEESRKLCGFRG